MNEVYKIDNRGTIYTWEELYEEYSKLIYDTIEIQIIWDDLQEIDLEGLSREAVQEKMRYVYRDVDSELYPGDIITNDRLSPNMSVVQEVLPNGQPLVKDLGSQLPSHVWKGPYEKIMNVGYNHTFQAGPHLFIKDPTKLLKLCPTNPLSTK